MNRPFSRLRLFAVIRQIRRWVRFGFGRERSAPECGSTASKDCWDDGIGICEGRAIVD